MDKLVPVIFQAINKGVVLSQKNERVAKDTINDHKLIIDFMNSRDPDGARSAMKVHILHAIKGLEIE